MGMQTRCGAMTFEGWRAAIEFAMVNFEGGALCFKRCYDTFEFACDTLQFARVNFECGVLCFKRCCDTFEFACDTLPLRSLLQLP